LENSDPALLASSHLPTAHHLVNTFVATLLQQQPLHQQQSAEKQKVHLVAPPRAMAPPHFVPPPVPFKFERVQPNPNVLSMFKPFATVTKKPLPQIDFAKAKIEDFQLLETLGLLFFFSLFFLLPSIFLLLV
jgi:hypothetical protein